MTQKHNYTRGPWQDNDAGLIYGQVSGDEDAAPFVCDVCDSPLDYTEQEKANARLITAGPELLQALEKALVALNTAPRFRVHIPGVRDSYAVAAICEAAITKAKGGAA